MAPGCYGKLEKAEERITTKDMAGTWITENNQKSSLCISEPCVFCTCICFSYGDFPYSGTMGEFIFCPVIHEWLRVLYFLLLLANSLSVTIAWDCGKNGLMGPCISVSFADKERIQITWLGCPADELIKAKKGDDAPAADGMEREWCHFWLIIYICFHTENYWLGVGRNPLVFDLQYCVCTVLLNNRMMHINLNYCSECLSTSCSIEACY